MSQFGHILRKDLYRLRWWLGAWLLVLGARATAGALAPRAALDGGVVERVLLGQLTGLVALLGLVLYGLIVARLVHDEPLVGLDWFWLTRPYDRRALVAAKLTLALAFLVVASTAADLAIAATFGVGLENLARAASVLVERDLNWTLSLMLLAVLTASLAGFAGAIAGVLAALVGVSAVFVSMALLTGDLESSPPSLATGDPFPALVVTAVWLLVLLASIVHMYRTRRRGRTLALAGVAMLVVLTVRMGLSAVPALTTTPGVPQDGRLLDVTAVFDRSALPVIVEGWGLQRGGRQVHLPVRLDGLPPEYEVQTIYARSRLVLADGHVLQSAQRGFGSVRVHADGPEKPHPVAAALGDVRLLSREERSGVDTAALLALSDDEIVTYGGRPGRLETELHFVLQRSRLAGTLPVREGAVLDLDTRRVEVVSVRRHYQGMTVAAHRWQVNSLLSTEESYRSYALVLFNERTREALLATSESFDSLGGSGGAVSVSGWTLFPLAMAAGAGTGFVLHTTIHKFPGDYASQPPTPALSDEWLDGARLAVVETFASDVIVRTAVLEDFRIVPETRASGND